MQCSVAKYSAVYGRAVLCCAVQCPRCLFSLGVLTGMWPVQDLYEYQTRFRMDFLMAESMLENIVQRFRPHSDL